VQRRVIPTVAGDPLGGQKLLDAQMVEGGPPLRLRQQQPGLGQQVLAPGHGRHLALLVFAVQFGEVPQQLCDLVLRGEPLGCAAVLMEPLAGMHAVGDGFQPGQGQRALGDLVQIAVVQHVVAAERRCPRRDGP
jgi:hypothetical protein